MYAPINYGIGNKSLIYLWFAIYIPSPPLLLILWNPRISMIGASLPLLLSAPSDPPAFPAQAFMQVP
jgi:hypothetical protein